MKVVDVITIGGIIAPVVTVVVGTLLAWGPKRIDAKAEQAVKLAQPTGNGFAAEVTHALGRIEERQTLTDRRVHSLSEDVRSLAQRGGESTWPMPHSASSAEPLDSVQEG